MTVLVNGNTVPEPNETFKVNLTSVSGATGNPTATGTILNDDGTATISINAATNIVAGTAGGVNALFTVTISSLVALPITVSFATQDNTAVANTDYVAQSGILTFDASHPESQVISVPILGAATAKPNETFFVNLSSLVVPPSESAALGNAQSTGTIIRQGLIVSNASVNEGPVGNTNHAVFTVTLNAVQDHTVTVTYATADGTATTADGDYVPTSGTLTFAAGVTSQAVSVAVVGNNVVEPNEAFSLNLSNPVGTAIIDGTGIGTIFNNAGLQARVRVVLAQPNGTPLSAPLNVNDPFLLEVMVTDIQAMPTGIYQDFVNAVYDSNLVNLASGATITYGAAFPVSHSASLATLGQVIDAGGISGSLVPPADPTAEELLFSVPMTAANNGLASFTVGPSLVQGHDLLEFGVDQPVPTSAIDFEGASVNIGNNVFVVNNVSQNEGNSGTTPFVFTVSRLLPPVPGDTATVVYTTMDGTATIADNDYVATNGTLTFSPTDMTETVTVLVNGDTKDEPDETFKLVLSNPSSGATVSGSPGIGTIVNDDAPPTISIATPDATPEGQNQNFVVSLGQVSGKTVTVDYTTASLAGDTATAGLDYTPTSGTLTFAPGDMQMTISVALLADVLVEPTETFHVVLSNPTNATLSNAQAVGSILDVPPAIISGFVYVDLNNDGIKESTEVGIAGVTLTAIRSGSNTTVTTTTAADGSYSFAGLQPGTWTVIETQPGFFVDGRDTLNGVDSPTNDEFTGITLLPSQNASGYDFGELGLRAQFAATFINRRAYFASSIVTGELGASESDNHFGESARRRRMGFVRWRMGRNTRHPGGVFVRHRQHDIVRQQSGADRAVDPVGDRRSVAVHRRTGRSVLPQSHWHQHQRRTVGDRRTDWQHDFEQRGHAVDDDHHDGRRDHHGRHAREHDLDDVDPHGNLAHRDRPGPGPGKEVGLLAMREMLIRSKDKWPRGHLFFFDPASLAAIASPPRLLPQLPRGADPVIIPVGLPHASRTVFTPPKMTRAP